MWDSAFNPGDFADFFGSRAERVLWYRAALCPCGSSPDGSQSNVNCKACGGLGRFYPSDPVTIRCVLTRVTQQMLLPSIGEVLPGDLICDQLPGIAQISQWDIILPTWSRGEPFEGETIVRGSGTTDALSYRAPAVILCATVDPATGAVTTYVDGTDFSASGKTVMWLGTANQPVVGALYTIRYDAQFEWVAFTPPQVRIERGTNFGPRCALRKRHEVFPGAPSLIAS